MDAVIELLKTGATLALLFFVLIAIATLFMFIFEIATGIDDRLSR